MWRRQDWCKFIFARIQYERSLQRLRLARALLSLWGCLLALQCSLSQTTGEIRGTAILRERNSPLAEVSIRLEELGWTTRSDKYGNFVFSDVPPGTYTLSGHLEGVIARSAQLVAVEAGQVTSVQLVLELAAHHERVTVTASGQEEEVLAAFQSVVTWDATDLAEALRPSLGEAVGSRPGTGIAYRGWGPGSTRPIIRGFDGDRVLILDNGLRSGTLSSQSSHHPEPVDLVGMDRLEVVKGPATLLYGSNAIGGVVNVIPRHHSYHGHQHPGLRGSLAASLGTANWLTNSSANFEYGAGKWMVWGGGTWQKTGDYSTPLGRIPNSRLREGHGQAGFGSYGGRNNFSLDVRYSRGTYGMPFAAELHERTSSQELNEDSMHFHDDTQSEPESPHIERLDIRGQRQSWNFYWTRSELSRWLERFTLRTAVNRWTHREIEGWPNGQSTIGTRFRNTEWVSHGIFEQRPRAWWSGRFGFWSLARAYEATGREALTPPVDQLAWAVFGLEQVGWERWQWQLAARVEQNRYRPERHSNSGHESGLALSDRTFTTFSAATGARVRLWPTATAVVYFTHARRAPALEELYSYGPHAGSGAFEIGSPDLLAERANGWEVSLRQSSARVRGAVNLFYYQLSRFIFPALRPDYQEGLPVVEFVQRDARYLGGEAELEFRMSRSLWLQTGTDYVDAQETLRGTPLPRIPPLRGRISLDWHRGPFWIKPELVVSARQGQVFPTETPTAGFAVLNVRATYNLVQGQVLHQVSWQLLNLTNRLYRNHCSFVKDYAPEMGRGVQITYRVRWF